MPRRLPEELALLAAIVACLQAVLGGGGVGETIEHALTCGAAGLLAGIAAGHVLSRLAYESAWRSVEAERLEREAQAAKAA